MGNRKPKQLGLFAAIALASALLPSLAHAYCRTTTCDPNVEQCEKSGNCIVQGLPLYWPGMCVSYSAQQDASPSIPLETFSSVIQTSFDTWGAANCGGGKHPGISIVDLGPVQCNLPEYNQPDRSGNANIIMFRDDSWPYRDETHSLALTTVTFNPDTGEIYDVDIEVNSAQNDITAGDTRVNYDLQSILTHELGHFLGLAHTDDVDATMYYRYQRTTTALRTIEPDDVAGVCAIYPPGRTGTCDPTPRHGFQSECGVPPEEGCCTSAPGRPSRSSISALSALILAVGLAAGRRRRAARQAK